MCAQAGDLGMASDWVHAGNHRRRPLPGSDRLRAMGEPVAGRTGRGGAVSSELCLGALRGLDEMGAQDWRGAREGARHSTLHVGSLLPGSQDPTRRPTAAPLPHGLL